MKKIPMQIPTPTRSGTNCPATLCNERLTKQGTRKKPLGSLNIHTLPSWAQTPSVQIWRNLGSWHHANTKQNSSHEQVQQVVDGGLRKGWRFELALASWVLLRHATRFTATTGNVSGHSRVIARSSTTIPRTTPTPSHHTTRTPAPSWQISHETYGASGWARERSC